MPKIREKYLIAGVDVYHVRNRNEKRVAQCLDEILQNREGNAIDSEMILDAYALALNKIPARYTQQGSIVLRDPLKKDALRKIVVEALDHVIQNPK